MSGAHSREAGVACAPRNPGSVFITRNQLGPFTVTQKKLGALLPAGIGKTIRNVRRGGCNRHFWHSGSADHRTARVTPFAGRVIDRALIRSANVVPRGRLESPLPSARRTQRNPRPYRHSDAPLNAWARNSTLRGRRGSLLLSSKFVHHYARRAECKVLCARREVAANPRKLVLFSQESRCRTVLSLSVSDHSGEGRAPNSHMKRPAGRYIRPAGRAVWAEHYLPVGAAAAARSRRG